MVKKELTWQIIQEFLSNRLKNTQSIMTFGTIGSCNLEHDIDVIITKKPNFSTSEFFKDIHGIFLILNKYTLKNFNTRVINFARLTDEAFIKSNFTFKKYIFFHTMVYVSLPQMEKDWAWSLTPADNFSSILKKEYHCIKGNTELLFSLSFEKGNYYDNVLTYLYLNDIFNSGYNKKVIIEVMQHLFDYCYRKRLQLKTPKIDNLIKAKKYFYELCDVVDKKNKEMNS
ncbi:hypothetical protein FJZ17_01790 [Candidatus Pacearchaeota archaeon]|nr:hypothetical protein [Candidatus Pacearchaeota archaeon]